MIRGLRALIAGSLVALATLACAPAAGAAGMDELMVDLGSGPTLTTQVVLGSGEDLTMTDGFDTATYALSSGSWGIGPDPTCDPDPPGASVAIACQRQTDSLVIDGQSGPHSISYRVDADPFLFTVALLSSGSDGWSSLSPNPERVEAGDGADTIIDQAGIDVIRLGPGADNIQSQDGFSDTIDCTGGGADTGLVDTSPAESYIGCPNSDGDPVVDLADACPAQTGSLASGCQPAATEPTPPGSAAKPAAKRCKPKKKKRGATPAKRCKRKRKP